MLSLSAASRWLKRAAAPLAVAAMMVLPGAASADARNFFFVNGSNEDVDYLYVVASETAEWGEDILGVEYMAPGEEVGVIFNKFVEGGCLYDIQVATLAGNVYEAQQFDLCSTIRVEFKGATADAFFWYYTA